MKLGEKIYKLRKAKKLSQEELGEKLDVTRQTISNWELGETNPNPEQLKKLSQELNISIDELLDNDLKDVIIEKVSNTESITKLTFDFIKGFLIALGLVVVLLFGLILVYMVKKTDNAKKTTIEESIYCNIYDEFHSLGMTYYEETGEIIEAGGDTYFTDVLELEKYHDAHQIFNIINDYVKKNNGSCTRFVNRDLSSLVELSIKDNTLTNTSATLILRKISDDNFGFDFGETYYLEVYDYDNNKWNSVSEKCSNCAFNAIGYHIDKRHDKELKVNWEMMYGKLDKGLYRIVKPISFDFNLDEFYLYAEFEID
ncbi:MAG: helix-turn-helix transcriptional regulator [Bacilli bacterium]|nr:helix-turn-helix transcriptional regulator [Bacilli bacterium]